MNNLFILLVMSLLFIGCNGDDDVTETPEEVEVSLLGTWQLIEQRFSNDAGGPFSEDELPFYEVESENTVTFYSNDIVTSTARSLCSNTLFENNPTSGIYNLIDSTYTSNDCANPNYKYPFTQTDSIVIISYPYNGISEGKFKKIADLEE
ncbi:hypothetical protein SCB49_04915 [unidentified eubacterium SCB49]|nr:hypothetical protein SCB49_04915 [unidentified eubacterium SCB49]